MTTTEAKNNDKGKTSIQDLEALFAEYKKREEASQGLSKQIEERMRSAGLI